MALESASSRLHLRHPLSSPIGRPLRFANKNLLMRKRSRLKLLARLCPPPVLSLPFDHLFHGLLSAFPSANSLDLIVPALGFASGAAFYFSALNRAVLRKELGEATGGRVDAGAAVIGEWVLFSSPTPFNRSVLVRCPSVSFEDSGELLEGVNDGLAREERPYVNMARGRILADEGAEEAGDEVSYQRLCVATGDGGVISLDWPENLELGREQGLDTTVLLVPGTPEGSMAGNVMAFVREALRHGCFPIVMNPRGCAGSPLTTPRLFTAADSDDVSTAIQFIHKSRPWATLMGIGWGYGASMLTKYLTNVGERTPLTAAVCFDNPFDLNEATKSLLHHNEMDKILTGGLVDILRANKELFQGKNRGFNVAKALSSERVRDFEGALSMFSYGFKSIEDFYAKSSTRQLVHRVKIPLLFIQSDDCMVPLFSIPRSSITENPFTSLLLCSRSPSDIMTNERSTIIWCQNLAIEWLSAVEIALLKGRHPLLNDVDITITPTKSIPMLKGRLSDMSTRVRDKINSHCDSEMQNMSNGYSLKLPNSNATSGLLLDPISTLLEKDICAYLGKANGSETCEVDIVKDAEGSQGSALGSVGSGTEESDSPLDGERSQVLATATVILNMLDVTMPGTLGDEQKKKVLAATEQGETFMKALQGAVPEDVRGKLMSAVSEIVHSQGNKINVRKLKKIGWISNISSSRNSKIEEQSGDISTADGPYCNPFADHKKSGVNSQERIPGDSLSNHVGEHNAQDSKESSGEKFSEASGHTESKLEFEGKQNQSSEPETISCSSETSEDNSNLRADDRPEYGHINLEASEPQFIEGKKVDARANEKIVNPSINHEESHASDSFSVDHEQFQKEANDVQVNNNENVQNSKKIEDPSLNHSSGNITVSQALDALTGFDDSTQMAVTTVFGVIENMIDHLERKTGKNDSGERKDGILDSDDTSKESLASNDDKFSNVLESSTSSLDVDTLQSGTPKANLIEKLYTQENAMEKDEKKLVHNLHSSDSVAFGRFPGSSVKLNNLNEVQRSVPLNLRMNPYWDFSYSYKGYLQKYTARMSNVEPLDIQSTTDLFLDPEEGRWKMLDQMESSSSIHDIEDHRATNSDKIIGSTLQETDREEIIEPLYTIPEMELPDLGYGVRKKTPTNNKDQPDHESSEREELGLLVKDTVLKALKVEVARRVGMSYLKETEAHIMHDLEQVADGIAYAIIHYGELSLGKMQTSSRNFGTIQGQQIIKTISRVVHNTSHLGKILPVGVIVGSILASLRKYFHVTVLHDDRQEVDTDSPINVQDKHAVEECDSNIHRHSLGMEDHKVIVNSSNNEEPSTAETSHPYNDRTMVGAVTAALGASALLAHHETKKTQKSNDHTEVSTSQIKDDEVSLKLHDKPEQVVQEKTENNLVSTLAEKAMSVAGPVVPTNNDGEVDHERLVAALAELGQKGGMLRLIGKVALLWGGIRGAISLTDRLISFLHISERPLFQRILGFVCMVLVMWSPVVIPLLPALVENWTLKSSRGIADYACAMGLYAAITILVVLWGRRIRGYENPLKQYGLDLASTSKVRLFLKGFIGGTMLVLYVHSVNALLGYACLVHPSVLPSSSNNTAVLLKTYGLMLVQTLKGVTTATFIAMVEELLFRSWLPEEIAVDHGYYQSIIISGILFSLLQRSFTSIPAFLFLSLALFGAKQRGAGTLFLPMGIRTGIITTNFIVRTGGFLYYKSSTPFWLASVHPSRPFDGIVGLGINILMAVLLFPHRPAPEKGTRWSK